MINELDIPSIELVKESARDSYATFCECIQDPGYFDPVHKELCDFIQYHYEEGQRVNKDVKLMVILPRGALKSTIITKYFPIWLTLKDSGMRSLIATNTHTNARKKLQDIRGVFETNKLFRACWPELLPGRKCRWTDEAAEVTREQSFPEATFEACGMNTRKTGTHYNVIIEDDTTAPQESDMKEDVIVPSMETIQKAIGWHKAATPLFVPKGVRVRIIVSTRWADYDLISYITEHECESKNPYKIFNVPALNSEGESNFSMFYDKEQLEEIKGQVGPWLFSALYLNRPLDASLRVFKDEWINYVSPLNVPDTGYYSIAIDPAISEKKDACETAITRVKHVIRQERRPFQFWTNAIVGHMNPLETVTAALDLAEEDLELTKGIIVETVAYQAALKFILRDEMAKRGIRVPIIPFQSKQNKLVRIHVLEPYFANGRILLVKGITNQVESQLKQFPHGKLIDIIDSFSMHVKMYKGEKAKLPQTVLERQNPDSIESIIDELQHKYQRRTGNGVGRMKTSKALGTYVGAPLRTGKMYARLTNVGRN